MVDNLYLNILNTNLKLDFNALPFGLVSGIEMNTHFFLDITTYNIFKTLS